MENIRVFIFDAASAKLLLSLVLGGILGIERQRQGRAAGLRTHILVCFASTSLITCFSYLPNQNELQPLRLAAGIMTGMGFIGAGTIMRSHNYVRGLTTSACLWLTAALGIIIGFGHYFLAIKTCILSFLVLLLFRKIDNFIKKEQFHILSIVADFDDDSLENVIKLCRQKGGRIIDLNIKKDKDKSKIIYNIQLKFPHAINNQKFINKIMSYPSVIKAIIKSI